MSSPTTFVDNNQKSSSRDIKNVYDNLQPVLNLLNFSWTDIGQFVPKYLSATTMRIYIVKALLMQGGFLSVPSNFQYQMKKRVAAK